MFHMNSLLTIKTTLEGKSLVPIRSTNIEQHSLLLGNTAPLGNLSLWWEKCAISQSWWKWDYWASNHRIGSDFYQKIRHFRYNNSFLCQRMAEIRQLSFWWKIRILIGRLCSKSIFLKTCFCLLKKSKIKALQNRK